MRKLLTSPWTLLAVIALLRLPGFAFGVLNIDESDYLVYGAGILKGLLPYRDLVEIKPPLGYLTYALAGGLNLWPIRILGVLWVFCTALLLRGAARRWTGSEEAGWAAAWMSLLAGLVEVPAFGGEVMMNLPVAASIYFFARSRRAGGLLLCGICVGLATLYRHHAVIAAVAFAVALLVRPAAAGGRFYEHYFLQFVPPLSMLAAPGAAALAARWHGIAPRVRGFALAGVAVPLAVWLAFSWGRGIAGAYPEQEPRTRALAQWLRANTARGDTLFVWGHYSPIYTMSDRLPGTRYVNTSPHMGNFDPAHLPVRFIPWMRFWNESVQEAGSVGYTISRLPKPIFSASRRRFPGWKSCVCLGACRPDQ